MCMSVLSACKYLYRMDRWCPQGSCEGVESPETGVRGGLTSHTDAALSY